MDLLTLQLPQVGICCRFERPNYLLHSFLICIELSHIIYLLLFFFEICSSPLIRCSFYLALPFARLSTFTAFMLYLYMRRDYICIHIDIVSINICIFMFVSVLWQVLGTQFHLLFGSELFLFAVLGSPREFN